jgi:hypothetical protein
MARKGVPLDSGGTQYRKILRADLDRLAADCRARHRQQPALLGYRQHRVQPRPEHLFHWVDQSRVVHRWDAHPKTQVRT